MYLPNNIYHPPTYHSLGTCLLYSQPTRTQHRSSNNVVFNFKLKSCALVISGADLLRGFVAALFYINRFYIILCRTGHKRSARCAWILPRFCAVQACHVVNNFFVRTLFLLFFHVFSPSFPLFSVVYFSCYPY